MGKRDIRGRNMGKRNIGERNIGEMKDRERNNEERENILGILKNVSRSIEKKNYFEIKRLSNKLVNHISAHHNPDLISVAIIIYALSKMIEREKFKEEKNWAGFYNSYLKNIRDMVIALEKDDINRFRDEVEANRKLIQGLTGKLKTYIHDVFRRARINKASKLYEQGISMESTAKILGVSLWDLSGYIGDRRVGTGNLAVTMPIRERVRLVEEIFK